jgi:hypothetical protein
MRRGASFMLAKSPSNRTRFYPPLEGLSAFGGFIRLWRVYPAPADFFLLSKTLFSKRFKNRLL